VAILRPGSLDGPPAELGAICRVEEATPVREGRGALCDLKFAPGSGARGGYLACAGHDRVIDLYRVEPVEAASGKPGVALRQVAVCRGHASTVAHIEWHAHTPKGVYSHLELQ